MVKIVIIYLFFVYFFNTSIFIHFWQLKTAVFQRVSNTFCRIAYIFKSVLAVRLRALQVDTSLTETAAYLVGASVKKRKKF